VRTEHIREIYDVRVELVHFPLHPETPAQGRPLQELFGAGPEAIAAKQKQMAELMAVESLPYGTRTHTYNSRLAQELGKWADTQPEGEAIHDILYKAYFVNALNIADPNVLLDCAYAAGLNRDNAREVLEQRTFKDAVDADWMKARRIGVTGVPTFVAGGAAAVGAQPLEVLVQLMEHAGAKLRD